LLRVVIAACPAQPGVMLIVFIVSALLENYR